MALSSMPEGFEPMQVDANSEENDNDVDDGRVLIGIAGNGVGPHGAITGNKILIFLMYYFQKNMSVCLHNTKSTVICVFMHIHKYKYVYVFSVFLKYVYIIV